MIFGHPENVCTAVNKCHQKRRLVSFWLAEPRAAQIQYVKYVKIFLHIFKMTKRSHNPDAMKILKRAKNIFLEYSS